ncbi:MAG TPA: O-antigen ligase family protein [Usitatibacter sp.]|jgi:O-antigen ligase|nr:O-antigen ligase family protein [Usitatibacter sp.]
MRFTDFIFAAALVYLPYNGHYELTLPVKGVNGANLAVGILLLIILTRHEKAPAPTPLRGRFFFFFFAALVLPFALGQFYDSSTFMDDVTFLENQLFFISLYFVFYHAPRDERSIRVMYGALILTLFLISLQGVRQALDYGIANFNPNRRVTGPFGINVFAANMAAGYFIIMLPVALTTALLARSRPLLRLGSVLCIFLGVFATFYTYSRQAYVTVAALFTFIGVRRSMIAVVLLLVLASTYEVWMPDTVMQRIEMTEHADAGGEEQLDNSTESRFLLWQAAMELLAEHPGGIGLNHFKRSIGSHLPQYKGFDAHNGFVLILTECGVLGLIAFLWLLAGLWGLARQVGKLPGDTSRLYGDALGLGVLGVICADLFGSRISNGEVMVSFWALAGLVARHYAMAQARAREAAKEPAQAPRPAGPPSLVVAQVHHVAGGARRQ